MPERRVPVVVVLPAALVRLFPGLAVEVAADGAGVGAALDDLDARWPGLRDRLCTQGPRLRPHVAIFVAGARVGLEHRLRPGERIVVTLRLVGG